MRYPRQIPQIEVPSQDTRYWESRQNKVSLLVEGFARHLPLRYVEYVSRGCTQGPRLILNYYYG